MSKPRGSRLSLYFVATIISAIGALLLFELGSFAALNYYVYPRDQYAFYDKPDVDRERYELYLRDRHPVLGWPVKSVDSKLDLAGSRPIPLFPDPGNECVATYGDSFTYGSEVEHDEAWSNVLSQRLGCRVANFGVPGYGTDQALLRFLELPKDPSQLVILGIYPHNVMRNVNQYRYFLTGDEEFGFKPRFILTDEGLSRIPMPDLDYRGLMESLSNPEKYYRHEAFIPESEFGPIIMSFPYSRVFLKYVTSERVRFFILGRPGWSGFVSSGHPSGALEVTAGIVKEFSRTATDRDKASLVVTFPSPLSYEAYLNQGEIAYQQLLDMMSAEGVVFVDLHRPIHDYLGGR
ncbi:MAG: hypothetical protein OET79_10900, partial [Nitrospirota bacterium]|nr:hypothetical protein [Nitrospirota bacterium]